MGKPPHCAAMFRPPCPPQKAATHQCCSLQSSHWLHAGAAGSKQPCISHFPHILQPDGFENIPKLLLPPLLFLSGGIMPPPSPPSKNWVCALRFFFLFFNTSIIKG